MRKTGLFTVKVKKEVYNTIQVSDKNKKENCPDKDDNDKKTETDDEINDKSENIEPKKE